MSYYSQILNKEMLQEHYIDKNKTSRQIAREFHVSRKMVNKTLLELGFINRRDVEDNDLP